MPDSTVIKYIIDGANRRVAKEVDGVIVQKFLYRDSYHPIVELDGLGNVLSYFVYGTRLNVPDYIVKGGIVYRIISDHLGSPRSVVNTSTGEITQRINYDEFGNIILNTNSGFQPFGFAGGLYDEDTNLTRFGIRDYDAETGRWTAKDHIFFLGKETNLYEYCKNDPINHIDISGFGWWEWSQSTGTLSYVTTYGDSGWIGVEYVAEGYSGCGDGLNNPDLESIKDTGPIPKGKWLIGDVVNTVTSLTIKLEPLEFLTETYGRGPFRIHGDNIAPSNDASTGCIILPKDIRRRIIQSGVRILSVVE